MLQKEKQEREAKEARDAAVTKEAAQAQALHAYAVAEEEGRLIRCELTLETGQEMERMCGSKWCAEHDSFARRFEDDLRSVIMKRVHKEGKEARQCTISLRGIRAGSVICSFTLEPQSYVIHAESAMKDPWTRICGFKP